MGELGERRKWNRRGRRGRGKKTEEIKKEGAREEEEGGEAGEGEIRFCCFVIQIFSKLEFCFFY